MLTQRKIGPFIAGEETIVSLWLGIYLRKRNLCRLVAPSWLNVEHLKKVLEHESDQNNQQFSRDLPFRYMEISRSILQSIGAGRSGAHSSGGGGAGVGNEEIAQVEVIRLLLEDISTVRMDKVRRSVHTMSAKSMGASMIRPMPIVDVTGIGSVELTAIKPFLERTFEDHFNIVRTGTGLNEDNQPNSNGRASSTRQQRARRDGNRYAISRELNEQHENDQNLLEPTAEGESSQPIARVQARRHRS